MVLSKKDRLKRDYRDICYFIDHVKDLDLRVDLIRSLGYKIGFNIVKGNESVEKSVIIGKRKEHRIQIVPITKQSPLLVKCAIVE